MITELLECTNPKEKVLHFKDKEAQQRALDELYAQADNQARKDVIDDKEILEFDQSSSDVSKLESVA